MHKKLVELLSAFIQNHDELHNAANQVERLILDESNKKKSQVQNTIRHPKITNKNGVFTMDPRGDNEN